MDDVLMIFIVIAIAVLFTGFNVFTIIIFVGDRKMRSLTSSYPIISFLLGSAIQGLLAAPTYIAKKLEHPEHLPYFICDLYRFPYFFCGHSMKFSLMIVSIDRLLAIRFPYNYRESITKFRMILALVITWVVTVLIDIIPFLQGHVETECLYHPTRVWGLTVICVFNFLPFCVIIVCYGWIWALAASITFQDKRIQDSLHQHQSQPYIDNYELKGNANKSGESCSHEKQPLKNNISTKSSRAIKNVRYAFEMKATKTSLMILGVYVVCWGPLGIFFTIDHFCHNCLSDDPNIHMSRTRMAIKLMCFSSSVIAPLVYCWRMNQFLRRAKSICCFLFHSQDTFTSQSEGEYTDTQ